MNTNIENKKSIPFWQALLPILTVIITGLTSVMIWKAGMIFPIISAIFVAGIVGYVNGFKWNEMQSGLVKGVSRALPALFIVMIIGLIIGSWIQGGVIPSLIYYSLKLISPSVFLPTACLVTAIVAVATGTSFASIATVGLALMATGVSMGFSPAVLAGAIISGAYFGDSCSPLSDTTNLASAVSGCTLFELIGHLMKSGIPALIISAIAYFVIGNLSGVATSNNLEQINLILNELTSSFVITPYLLIIPIITIAFSIKKFPAIPSLLVVALLGALAALFVQGNDLGSTIRTMTSGFVSKTGNTMIDSLLTRGGIVSMGSTVLLLTAATAFGGIIEEIGALHSILSVIMKYVRNVGSLVFVTVATGLVVAFSTGAQLLAVVIPARMYSDAFKKYELHPKNLGRIAQSIGTTCINLVPWSVPALYAQKILGVSSFEFIPYIFYAYIIIIINLIFGFTGISMDKTKG